ncbi:putative glutathione s-transferase [Fusarium longipes]|uniref:glutathione transferase n=1 Tax=Fusarium longipes TaxID=694270 RepID=A0A395SX70_9HYPO|nr:putative glutathione s-transferase [Fusarium longipes]
MLKAETRTPEHREKHPFGKIPVLDVGNHLIPSTRDLEATASFEDAASMEVCYFSTSAFRYSADIIIKPKLGIPRIDEKALQEIWGEVSDAMKVMDGTLSRRTYLAGSEFTLVDIWKMPWVYLLIELKGGADALFSGLPHLRQWWETVIMRPASQEAYKLMSEAYKVMNEAS